MEVKTAILLRTISQRTYNIYKQFGLTKTDYGKEKQTLDDFCTPQDETYIDRHRRLSSKQYGSLIEQLKTKRRKQTWLCLFVISVVHLLLGFSSMVLIRGFNMLTDGFQGHALVQGINDM